MKQKFSTEESNKLASGLRKYKPGVFETPNGYIISTESAQIFINVKLAFQLLPELQELCQDIETYNLCEEP